MNSSQNVSLSSVCFFHGTTMERDKEHRIGPHYNAFSERRMPTISKKCHEQYSPCKQCTQMNGKHVSNATSGNRANQCQTRFAALCVPAFTDLIFSKASLALPAKPTDAPPSAHSALTAACDGGGLRSARGPRASGARRACRRPAAPRR